MENYKNTTVVITGGAQGIGSGLSQAFAEAGAFVVMADKDEDAGIALEYALREKGLNVRFYRCDIAFNDEVIALFEKVKKLEYPLKAVVNNAGVSWFKSLESLTMAAFEKVLDINLNGTMRCCLAAMPLLKAAGGGAIVNMASTRALMSEPGSEAYAASKGGIVALTHALAVSLSNTGIRVNAISPGWIEVRDRQKPGSNVAIDHRKIDKEQHPVGRVGVPEDIAAAALYLCSEKAGFVTGQNFVIDGGMTIKMHYEH